MMIKQKYINHHSMRVMFLAFLFVWMVFIPNPVNAQSPQAERDVLQNYINLAIQNNTGLQAGATRVEASRLMRREFGSLGDPMVELEYDVWSRMEPGSRFRVALMQPLSWFGKLSATRTYYDQRAEAQQYRFEGDVQDLVYQIRTLWYEMHELEHHTHLLYDNLETLEQLESQIMARLESGLGSQIDALRIQIEKKELQNRIESYYDAIEGLAGRFNALLNRDPDAEIALFYELLPEPIPNRYQHQPAVAENPDLRYIDAETMASQTAEERARLDGRPDFSVGVGFMNRDLLLGDPERMNGIELMVRFNLPVYRNQYRARSQRARLETRALQQQREQLESQLSGEFFQAKKSLGSAARQQSLYKENLIPLTEHALELALSQYAAGAGGFEQIIQLQRQLLDLNMSYTTAVIEQNKAIARLDLISGQSSFLSENDF